MPLDPDRANDFVKDDQAGVLSKKEIAVKYGISRQDVSKERKKYAHLGPRRRSKGLQKAPGSSRSPKINDYAALVAKIDEQNVFIERLKLDVIGLTFEKERLGSVIDILLDKINGS